MEAVFQATYADFKNIKTRGVVQIIFEAPVENANEILTVLGGMPRAAEERWFAIARLNIGGAALTATGPQPTSAEDGSADKRQPAPGKVYEAPVRNPLTWEAVKYCRDPEFRLFLERTFLPRGNHCNDEDTAAKIIYLQLEIKSRAEIIPGSAVADKWDRLKAKFIIWKTADRYVEAPRTA